MMHELILWLYLNVWGNLIASMICGISVFLFAHFKFFKPLVRSHQELRALIEKAHDRQTDSDAKL